VKHTISVKNKQRVHTCSENKNLMDGLSVNCDLVPKGCHNGACGVCKIQVISGEYSTIKMNRKHISLEEENNSIVLACRVFPKSDMEIEFIPKIISKKEKKVYVLGS